MSKYQTFFKPAKCKCGKKSEYHGFCEDCWNDYGKELVISQAKMLADTKSELEILHKQRKSQTNRVVHFLSRAIV